MAIRIAVIGDHGMPPRFFADAVSRIPDFEFVVRTVELDWPDTPMVQKFRPGVDPRHLEGLREFLGNPDSIVETARDCEILITHLAPMSAAMLKKLPSLRLIGVCRGGPINIDLAGAKRQGVKVVNAPGRNASAVAEFTVGMILAEIRNITKAHAALAGGQWRGDLYRIDRTGNELCDLTVGVIGYSHIGTRVVRLLKPFGCRILVCDPYQTLSDDDRGDGVQQVGFDELLGMADVVTLHARVTGETRGLIGVLQLAAMKPGAYLINTARGDLVDYAALYDALVSGQLRGAALDTFDREPPLSDSALLKLPNVTLTPHISGASVRTVRYSAEVIASEIGRFLRSEQLAHACV